MFRVALFMLVGMWIALIACKSGEKQPTTTDEADTDILSIQSQPMAPTQYPEWLTTDYVMGKFNPADNDLFVKIPVKYADREGLYLRKETFEAYLKMHKAAKQAGFEMVIRSATRNFDYQKGIWERKWTGKTTLSDGTNAADIADMRKRALKILEYSSMPSTSRHHWGTDFDINAFNNAYFETGAGKGLYQWLTENASSFGFCQPYTPKGTERPHGYNEEKWHWTYLPLSKTITSFAREKMTNQLIRGFAGHEQSGDIDVVNKYIVGINPNCQ